jgi:hypothetical protein
MYVSEEFVEYCNVKRFHHDKRKKEIAVDSGK